MRAVRYHEHGGVADLTVEEVPEPTPGAGEIAVRVEAAALNPVDRAVVAGELGEQPPPAVPGSDVAGVVEAAGEGADLAVGDRVFGTRLGLTGPGSLAATTVAPAGDLAVLPDGVSFAEGAAVALVGATAWRALWTHGDLEPGDRALVHGGNGGVGHVAVQLADALGARVTATARPAHHDRLDDLGVDVALDYRDADLEEAVRAAGRPDLVLDHRLDEYLALDTRVLADGGLVVAVGGEGGATLPDLGAARARELALQNVAVFSTPRFRPVLDRLGVLLADGAVVPEIHRSYDLGETVAAYEALATESFTGKLVVRPTEG